MPDSSSYGTLVFGTSGVTHYWPCNELSGNALDNVGTQDFALGGGYTQSTTGVTFNGTSGYAQTPSAGGLFNALGTPYTYEFWYDDFVNNGAGDFIFTDSRNQLQATSQYALDSVNSNITVGPFGSTNIPIIGENYVAFTFDGTVADLYLNGVLNTTGTSGTGAGQYDGSYYGPTPTISFGLACNIYGGFPNAFANMKIRRFAIYSVALTAAQISNRYSTGASAPVTPPAPSTNFTSFQISFGNDSTLTSFVDRYIFPFTTQISSNTLKTVGDSKKVPFGFGTQMPSPSLSSREIVITCDQGSLISYQNSPSSSPPVHRVPITYSGILGTLLTAADLEAERNLLAYLQAKGPQKLFLSSDRFLLAYLSEFSDDPFMDAYGFRLASWKLTFTANDPRYYGITANSITSASPGLYPVSHLGNTRSYPTFNSSAGSSISIGNAQNGFVSVTGLQGNGYSDPRQRDSNQYASFGPVGSIYANTRIVGVRNFRNTRDFSEPFPYIESSSVDPNQQYVGFSSITSSNQFNMNWLDTWL